MSSAPRLATLWLAIVSSACGPSAADYPFVRGEECETPCQDAGTDAGPSDAGPPVIPDEPLEAWDTAGAGPLSGVFAVEVTIPARAVVDIETRQLYRLRVLQRDRETRLRITPCRFSLPAVPSVATLRIPPRLEAVLRGLSIESEGAFLSAADPIGARLTPPTAWVVLGAALADVERDPLPSAEDLAAAIDQDDDGHPGVTIGAETVLCRSAEELYAALRASVTMSATLDDLDRFEGAVTPTLEQTVLGFSHECLTAAANLAIEILEGSRFVAVRAREQDDLDGNGNVSCPEITWNATRLFGEHWADAP